MDARWGGWRRYALLGLGLAAFLLYAATTAGDVLPADSGEFQLVAARWGIAHPPGSALYTVAGALWTWLCPWGSAPFRLNLFSALLAALTLVLVAEATRLWGKTIGLPDAAAQRGGIWAALALAAAATFWAQATIANIRMPTLLFTAWGYLALARYSSDDAARRQRALLELALALGLGVGHHPSLAFIAVGWALYLLLYDPKLLLAPQRWSAAAGVAALAWLIPQLYLPLRGSMPGVALAPENLGTWSGFWQHVMATGFGGDMFAHANPTDLALRLPMLPTLFTQQFPLPLLALIAAAWVWIVGRQPRVGLALFVSWALHTFVTITYRAPQTVEYLAPAYIPMALIAGLGFAALAGSTIPWRRWALAALSVWMVARLPLRLPNFAHLAADTSIRTRSQGLLDAAPSGALILADWHWATPLWVLQQVEGRRPDVEIAYVYPIKGSEYDDVWRARAEEAGDRPLLTTHFYEWEGWSFAPATGGFAAYRRPLARMPETLGYTPHVADLGPLRLLGYRFAGEWRPGRRVELWLAWQAVGAQNPPPSFTGRVWDAEAQLLAQADRFLGSDTTAGEVRFTRLTLALPFDRCTAAVYPTLGAYRVADGGFQDLGSLSLPEQAMHCAYPTLPVEHIHPGYVVGGPFLRGVDYDVADERITAYLHWCGPGARLTVQSSAGIAAVGPLALGKCQTVRLPVAPNVTPAFTLTRADGAAASLLTLPLPVPRPGQRYAPFADELVLTGDAVAYRGGQYVVDLRWRVGRPLVEDYAISVRLVDAEGQWIDMHDFQPGLSTMPTLKWLVSGDTILDPHPFTLPERLPARVAVGVYERFLMYPLAAPTGDVVAYPLP